VLVPPQDPVALAAGIERALSLDCDAAEVSSAFVAGDWDQSARCLHASLAAACDGRAFAHAA
jgi:hypothetical protein